MNTETATKTQKGRIVVDIVGETAKASKVRDAQGREAWVQDRWLKEEADGTLTVSASTFDKQAEAHGEAEAWREGFHGLTVVRESEKAIAVEVALSVDGTGTGTTLAWFPKSRCKEEDGVWMAQGWLIRRNLGEALQYKKGRHTHYRLEGRIHIVGGEVFEVA